MEGLMKYAVLAVDWCIPKESYLGQLGLNLFPNVTFEPVKMKCTKESISRVPPPEARTSKAAASF